MSMMFSSRERNRSSVPDGGFREGFMAVSPSLRTENHATARKGIPFRKLQGFEAETAESCKNDYFKTTGRD